jgi:dolichol-phosphate mannosyltransferase
MADMSDDIKDLINYYNLIKRGNADAVFGSRFLKKSKVLNYPFTKLILNRIFNLIVSLLFLSKYNDYTNAFKIYKKNTLLELKPFISENFNIFLELPLKIISRKYTFIITPINWYNRKIGKSKFKIRELGSKYLFTLLYCWLEKVLLKKNIRNK